MVISKKRVLTNCGYFTLLESLSGGLMDLGLINKLLLTMFCLGLTHHSMNVYFD